MLLKRHNVAFEIIRNDKPMYSVKDAIGYYELHRIAPVLIVKTEMGYYALIVAGSRGRIDFELIKKALHCEKVKLASKKGVLETTGHEVNNVPLVGHTLPCVLDTRLLLLSFVYGGVGDPNFTLKMDPRDLGKVNTIVATIE